MIDLHYSNGKIFVWNVDDVYTLRKDYHIVGSLTGCYPIKPFQVQSKWLPLQLLPEEAGVLINKGLGQLVSIPDKVGDPSLVEAFYAKREELCEEQVILLKEHRKREILEKADLIYEGKKRKFLENLEKNKKAQKTSNASTADAGSSSKEEEQIPTSVIVKNPNLVEECSETTEKDLSLTEEVESDPVSESKSEAVADFDFDKNTIIEAEFAKIPELSKELCMVQLFTENPWNRTAPCNDWKYPCVIAEKLRFAIFRDLWERGYYITTGSKFGGDFLVYEGDPLKYHALYVVVCMSPMRKFQGNDLVVYGRLGHQVKKTVVLASINNNNDIEYISINWENEML